VSHFLKKFQEGKEPIRIEPDVLETLIAYPWLGNVRELANVLQQMMTFCRRNTITMKDVPPHLLSQEERVEKGGSGQIKLMKMVSDIEKKWILSKLKESNWNQEKTAKLLGITRKMLTNRINKYNFKLPRDKLSKA
jgi:DNA-binding NtrC family response regulator